MRGIRVRWRELGRTALAGAAALVALWALPGLLTPPEPPPLPADVGLPRTKPRFEMRPQREKGTTDRRVGAARAVISSRRPRREPRPEAVAPQDAAPVSPATPPPPAVAAPAAAPPEMPAPPPGDGSEEFAPR